VRFEDRVKTPESELQVQVVDDEIIVTLPGSSYSVTYYKPENSPQLLALAAHQFSKNASPWRSLLSVAIACTRGAQAGWRDA